MKICLTRVRNNSAITENEYNLSICIDGCIGRTVRKNLPSCICGDGIKINIIVSNCDGVLPAPLIQCNDLLKISSPIKVIRRNPCCNNTNNLNNSYSDIDIDDFDFLLGDKCESYCNIGNRLPQEYAIIIRSYNSPLSGFLCEYPQMYVMDCENTIKLIFIFDKTNSAEPCGFMDCCDCCCGCNFWLSE